MILTDFLILLGAPGAFLSLRVLAGLSGSQKINIFGLAPRGSNKGPGPPKLKNSSPWPPRITKLDVREGFIRAQEFQNGSIRAHGLQNRSMRGHGRVPLGSSPPKGPITAHGRVPLEPRAAAGLQHGPGEGPSTSSFICFR